MTNMITLIACTAALIGGVDPNTHKIRGFDSLVIKPEDNCAVSLVSINYKKVKTETLKISCSNGEAYMLPVNQCSISNIWSD